MKTRPVVPAAPAEERPGHALAQADRVFLQGSQLPGRWARRERCVVLELGFGLGHNVLATWRAWQQDSSRCERLFFVSIEPHPPTADDLLRAHAGTPLQAQAAVLARAWPPMTANLHGLDFEGGRVRLLLAWGEIAPLLAELHLHADAFFLGEAAAAQDRRVCKALARLAAPGATLAASHADTLLRDGLTAAGFELEAAVDGTAPGWTVGRHAPRFKPRSATPPATPPRREALVVGAGLAGAAAAASLAALGWAVQVVDRHAAPAAETSGNPAGLFHGTLHTDDGPHARLFRAAALAAERQLRPLIERGAVPGQLSGLLRLDAGPLAAMQALVERQHLPPDWVQALGADAASQRAGLALPGPAWWFPGGGWLEPPALVRHWLQTPGVRYTGGIEVARLQMQAHAWQAIDAQGQVLAQAPVLVLANAGDALRLLAPLGHAPWPLQRSRGQVSGWHGTATALQRPVAGDGYALPLPAGGLLCGATVALDDGEASLREADHRHNFDRLARLTGLLPPGDRAAWFGRVGWRLQADDRLPVVGPVPLADTAMAPGTRLDQARWVPRSPGLHVLTGLGARGITLAPLMGQLLAARIEGTPWPLERDLADAVDPARWRVRRARREAG